MIKKNKASFRDPAGYVIEKNNKIYRAIRHNYISTYNELKKIKFYKDLKINEFCLGFNEVDQKRKNKILTEGNFKDVAILLEQPKVDLITYPYELTFNDLKNQLFST